PGGIERRRRLQHHRCESWGGPGPGTWPLPAAGHENRPGRPGGHARPETDPYHGRSVPQRRPYGSPHVRERLPQGFQWHLPDRALGVKVAHFIPNDPKTINGANNAGMAAVLKAPTAKVSRSFVQLAAAVQGGPAVRPPEGLRKLAFSLNSWLWSLS